MQNLIRKDMLVFGAPALTVFLLGLVVSAAGGYDGLVGSLWRLATEAEAREEVTGWNIAGLAIFALGMGIALVAVFTLGRFYSSSLVTREEHRLITHGIYRVVRHPIYLGVLLACFGPPVYAPSLPGALIMALLIPIFLNRIRIEERMLGAELGQEHRDYQNSTSKLIPFLY